MNRQEIVDWLREDRPAQLADLWRRADRVRQENVGGEVYLRGLIELSNYCVRQCAYCGLRAENTELQRYRMTDDEVLACARQAAALGCGTAVLQAGEDPGLERERIAGLIRRLKAETPLAVTLSLGERTDEELAAWRTAGADRYLLRFETANLRLYDRIHPKRGLSQPERGLSQFSPERGLSQFSQPTGQATQSPDASAAKMGLSPLPTMEDTAQSPPSSAAKMGPSPLPTMAETAQSPDASAVKTGLSPLPTMADTAQSPPPSAAKTGPSPSLPPAHPRLAILATLRRLGYEVGSGVMIGIPGQTWDDVADDIALFAELDLDMIGVGPYVVHPGTPLAAQYDALRAADAEQVPADELTTYKVIALARLVCPRANIPSTTALATIGGAAARDLGLERGANVVMPNFTPMPYRTLYEIYPAKACLGETPDQCAACLGGRIARLGRSIGTGPGHSPNVRGRRR